RGRAARLAEPAALHRGAPRAGVGEERRRAGACRRLPRTARIDLDPPSPVGHRATDVAVPDARVHAVRDRALQPRDTGGIRRHPRLPRAALHGHRARRQRVLELLPQHRTARGAGREAGDVPFVGAGVPRAQRAVHRSQLGSRAGRPGDPGRGLSPGGRHAARRRDAAPARLDPRDDRAGRGADADAGAVPREQRRRDRPGDADVRVSALPEPRPIREAGPVDPARFHGEIRPAREPVILRGLAADWPGVAAARRGDRAMAEYLLSFGPTRPVRGIVLPAEAEGRFFYDAELRGLNFTSHEDRLSAFLGELLHIAEEPQPKGVAVQSEKIPELLPGFAEANPMPLVPGVVPRIWIGNRIRVAPHYDLMENVGVCLAGRRRFTVFPPEQLANMYPGPFELTPAGTPVSMVDPAAPDLERYPRYAEAWTHAQRATLE